MYTFSPGSRCCVVNGVVKKKRKQTKNYAIWIAVFLLYRFKKSLYCRELCFSIFVSFDNIIIIIIIILVLQLKRNLQTENHVFFNSKYLVITKNK